MRYINLASVAFRRGALGLEPPLWKGVGAPEGTAVGAGDTQPWPEMKRELVKRSVTVPPNPADPPTDA